ncbi:hypothetical protein MJO28_004519 [Puccinia striiformis f. sp. tritici]|uniref:F-box domain-containing protein n=3 Tax=Puccinia striiformis TaxID=27350 RepID=A0A0L0US72_9BASI|nr:hypothetical protein Pst134EA_006908 [Puccinia striiformis f. sp. tritici]KNE89923.1 hypothetical protein PSTG_16627 [Puccinia striiformis f. sp. tritici PST-78]POW05568.1 hypothetical protein PSTT_09611 [Puccinia striiformis]KAH9459811.1 hypothetical protein Pst134EB_008036 [Puccinia striiformis f. sp. tritici]KAH9469620.1 hypothetical protein Pst134EA_006908 [Puccinia striiformis f. sp. tritici]KAI7957424.1 hypothetical protein MJO28_004519 [Puccinia striiformis f. sp. tritici]
MDIRDGVFDQVMRQIEFLIQDECGGASALSRKLYLTEIARLRLVCREWRTWIYERHLYRQLSITDSDASKSLCWWVVFQSRQHSYRRPICQYLKISDLLICEAQNGNAHWTVRLDWLNELMNICSDTIVELDIGVINYFTLPSATIERICGMKNLRTLRIRCKFWGPENRAIRAGAFDGQLPDGLLNDSDCLRKLLTLTQGLETVDLTDFRPRSPMTTLRSGDDGFSNVTALYLNHKICGNLSQLALGSILSSALPNIKLLSIQGGGYHGGELLPVFESLRERLEELFVVDARVLEPMLHLRFPKLRILRLYTWSCYRLPDVLRQPMFVQAPLQVIALRVRGYDDYNILFGTLPHLRRLVFCGPEMKSPVPPYECLLQRAAEHGVECVHLPDENQIYRNMSES